MTKQKSVPDITMLIIRRYRVQSIGVKIDPLRRCTEKNHFRAHHEMVFPHRHALRRIDTLDTPMLWALGFIAEFLIGGVTGIFLGSSGTDIYLHDTYFVIAHFHYTFVPIAIIAVFAGLTFWYPKMFGRMLNEALGKNSFLGQWSFRST